MGEGITISDRGNGETVIELRETWWQLLESFPDILKLLLVFLSPILFVLPLAFVLVLSITILFLLKKRRKALSFRAGM